MIQYTEFSKSITKVRIGDADNIYIGEYKEVNKMMEETKISVFPHVLPPLFLLTILHYISSANVTLSLDLQYIN